MDRYVCIHGHFYQPERENPWLEAIERQASAYPYHDWNERVTAECYAPNALSRIMDEKGRIVRIRNNYERISFNVGPTLLAWMEAEEAEIYRAILDADASSRERFSGHGSAMAQVYNHMILPLANARDRRTQVLWGMRDFERRFRRAPEGMWLPETAVDTASLEELAGAGIRFTVLAPHQAARVRPLDDPEAKWTDVTGSRVDPTRPYLQRLPSGAEIVLFFYDGPVSRAVAFEGLLRDGARFAERLMGLFHRDRGRPQLVHIATDGETYGHHHRHGEMALSYALERIEVREDARLTNYAEYLSLHPPDHEVEIVEDSSWSCAHGVERWRSDCGCSTGGEPGWNQAWRAPLREALDWLRDRLTEPYEEQVGELLEDPWRARDAYIDVVLDRSRESLDRFFAAQCGSQLSAADRVEALKLLELQRQAMLMYTSCGWFFTDLAGIETVQVIEYAGRAIQLARELLEEEVEEGFLERLERAESNVPEQGNGRRIYEERIRPNEVDLRKVCAHHALSSLFDPVGKRSRVYCYRVEDEEVSRERVGRSKLLIGRARVESEITGEWERFAFAALHFGDHHVQGGVRRDGSPVDFFDVRRRLTEAFEGADLTGAMRLLDGYFGDGIYSLRSLFRDAQHRILGRILEPTLREVAAVYRGVYERQAPLMRFVAGLGAPQPRALRMTGEFVLDQRLRDLLRSDDGGLEEVADLLEAARAQDLELDGAGLGLELQALLDRLARRAQEVPDDPARMEALDRAVDLARSAPFEVSLWGVQNRFWRLGETAAPRLRERAASGDPAAEAWLELFAGLGEKLAVSVDER